MADQLILKTKNFKVEYLSDYKEFQLNMLQVQSYQPTKLKSKSECESVQSPIYNKASKFKGGDTWGSHVGKCVYPGNTVPT